MKPVIRYAIAVGMLLFSMTAFAGGARDEFRKLATDLKGLQGDFNQRVFDDNGRLKETASGNVAISAPRLLRWEYTTPYPQLIVADGEKIWIYDPDLRQVTVRSQGEERRASPLSALTDPDRLERDYDVSEEAIARQNLDWLTITPKVDAPADFQLATLGFGPGGLQRMEIIDLVGQRSVIEFSNWRRDPTFPAGTFTFVPDPDVDVVGE